MAVSALQSPPEKANTKCLIHHLPGLCFSMCTEPLLKLQPLLESTAGLRLESGLGEVPQGVVSQSSSRCCQEGQDHPGEGKQEPVPPLSV